MQSLLQGDHPALSVLRAQWDLATVKSREFSSGGFFVDFSLPAEAPSLGARINFEIGDVSGDISGVACGFLLFVRDGLIDFLEGHVWGGEQFPASPVISRLFFVRHKDESNRALVESPSRDIEALAWKLPGTNG